MIDFIVLEQMTAFAVIMQKHPGWVGLLQSTILESVGCIWFNRSEAKDRETVARKLREHVLGADNNPLLIFPEGTCVNNHYTVMFKKDIDRSQGRVAREWNSSHHATESEVWSSRKRIMGMRGGPLFIGGAHGPYLITWAIVTSQGPHLRIFPKDKIDVLRGTLSDGPFFSSLQATVGFVQAEVLPLRLGSSKVRDIISVRAGLKKVPWDGYLKYSRPSPKHRERNIQGLFTLFEGAISMRSHVRISNTLVPSFIPSNRISLALKSFPFRSALKIVNYSSNNIKPTTKLCRVRVAGPGGK
ncbi:glycerol-3-phosphate acyltransferase 9 [Actinidia rufa]|uniref:Glycerol-3-phosphate acyltransferase 9 n=1 Tax=Actinidia rufa TaxID=165716 RepID=A0A7J0FNU8_9ERIC|nr:glycerol-3-phosphate acyltransferase 9 [Actinidia rufa]